MLRPRWTVEAVTARALETARASAVSGSRIATEGQAAQLLLDVIGCDRIIHTDVRMGSETRVRSGPDLDDDAVMSSGLSAFAERHPAVLSYLSPDDDGSPRRVTDVVTLHDWLNGPVYSEVFRGSGGRFQLSVVTSLTATTGSGWVLLRDGRDYTAEEVARATQLLPQMVTLAAISALKTQTTTTGPRAFTSEELAGLTERERCVLRHLSTGATAAQIARQLGIAPATARKHLQHIYAKLDVHDRLSAVLHTRSP